MDTTSSIHPINSYTTKPSANVYQPWLANLELAFDREEGRTTLSHNQHSGPIRVQKTLYPEGESVCQVLVVHPPGGLANGDSVNVQVSVSDRAHAQVTTPGAGKWYRSFEPDTRASWHQSLQLQGNAVLEYLPQESIVFNGASAYSHCDIDICEHGMLAISDILCLGCPASGESFDCGEYRSDWQLRMNGELIWRERARLQGGSELLKSPVGLRGRTVMGTMLFSTPHTRDSHHEVLKSSLQLLRGIEVSQIDKQMLAGVTALPCGIIVRVLAQEAEHARAYFTECWKLLRPVLIGHEALVPRIWST